MKNCAETEVLCGRTRPPGSLVLRHLDQSPPRDTFREDVLAGLGATPRTVPCKYLYDARGSALFERICNLPEYYLTRAELAIMRHDVCEMARLIGEQAVVIELGSGSGHKTRLLLDELAGPAAYVPVDISRTHLVESAAALAQRHSELRIVPLCADYTRPFEVPQMPRTGRRIAYFPGSTIGNLHPGEATALLRRLVNLCGHGGALLIGFDLRKSRAALERAYNDSQGVTAEFNFNLLRRMNRELGGNVDPAAFDFCAVWNDRESRVESFLISRISQTIRLAGESIKLGAGERVRTECSYKYTKDGFAALAQAAGWRMLRLWTDEQDRFAVALLDVDASAVLRR